MPFTLTDDALNALLDQLPVLAGRPRRLEDLSGGLTNRNVKVSTDNGVYVARCADPANLLGIDRESEFYNSRAAEQAGVGAPVIDYRPDLGILLVGFLNGVTLSNDDFQRPGVIAKVAAGCRALHAGPRFRGDFDMFALQPRYLKVVVENGFRLPADYLELRREVRPDPPFAAGRGQDTGNPDGAVSQRPAGSQLPRRRRQGVADRLRVLRQQRRLLRTRQHLA